MIAFATAATFHSGCRRRAVKRALAQGSQERQGARRLDARSRHKLRIQTKKLRYAVEFFASVFEASAR